MASSTGDMEDYSLEEEVTLAMEEIQEKEKDLKQLVETAQFLFERSEEMTFKCEEQSDRITMLNEEQARVVDSLNQNENRVEQQKERISQLERIEIDLERQL